MLTLFYEWKQVQFKARDKRFKASANLLLHYYLHNDILVYILLAINDILISLYKTKKMMESTWTSCIICFALLQLTTLCISDKISSLALGLVSCLLSLRFFIGQVQKGLSQGICQHQINLSPCAPNVSM